MASSSNVISPCASCKLLRRKCVPGCIFAPYFPPEEPHKFIIVHKIFGASNVSKLLNEIVPHQREDAVNSLAYEAEARLKDPVYGCVGAISVLQRQVMKLQKELEAINVELLKYRRCNDQIQALGVVDQTVADTVADIDQSSCFCYTSSFGNSYSEINHKDDNGLGSEGKI